MSLRIGMAPCSSWTRAAGFVSAALHRSWRGRVSHRCEDAPRGSLALGIGALGQNGDQFWLPSPNPKPRFPTVRLGRAPRFSALSHKNPGVQLAAAHALGEMPLKTEAIADHLAFS